MREEGTEWQVLQELVRHWIIQFEDGEDDDSDGVSDHHLSMVEELACNVKEREVVRPCVNKELDGSVVDLQCKSLQKGDEDVHQLFIIEVKSERDHFVQKGVAQNIV